MPRHLKIGEFSRLTGLSVKALRFYADEGVLQPVKVDATSGYRFYDPAQVQDATRVVNLREAGVSLADIRELQANDEPELLAILRQQRASLLREKARIESRLQVTASLLSAVGKRGVAAIEQVRLITLEPEFVYVEELPAMVQDGSITETFERAERLVAGADARAKRSPFMLIHNTASAQPGSVEVCIPVRDDRIDQLPTTLVTGAQVAAAATYAGEYSQTQQITKRLRDWIGEAGLLPVGPVRETYRRFGANQEGYTLPKTMLASRSSDYVTEIQVVIQAPETSSIGEFT